MNNSILQSYKRQSNESLDAFLLRLAEEKKINKNITWQGIADALGINFGIEKSERWVRRKVAELSFGEDDTNSVEEIDDLSVEAKKVFEKTLEMRKERVKIADERTQVNAYVRKLSREETLKEIAFETAKELSSKKLLPVYNSLSRVVDPEKEAILCISDWHYGIEIKNPWNEFSPEVCRNRVAQLRDKVIEHLKTHKIGKLYIANLGDLIAGRIHLGLRLDSRIDVITQTIQVSEILAEFMSSISKYVEINYYDVLDNHSRLEPNKNDAQDLETLARIIPWYLKERLKENTKIQICENKFGWDLMTFESLGHKIIGVHGDKDKPLAVIDHVSMMTEQHYDLVLTAHLHHYACDEKNRTICVSNSSLMGTDSFAQKLRLSATPSQNLIILSRGNPTECIYRITLA